MTRVEFVDYFIAKSKEAGFELSSVRKELEARGVDPEEIKLIVRLVDDKIQREALKGASNKKGKELIYGGGALALFGAITTIGTYIGVFDTGSVFIIAYGPFFGGIGMLLAGLAQQRK